MRRVCAWCLAELGGDPDGPITHGVCKPCLARLTGEPGAAMDAFLEGLAEAVLIVDDGQRCLSASAAARAAVGKTLADVARRLPGEVFDCVHAREPGGCGRTPACGTCALRRAVLDTYWTGRPHIAVPVVIMTGDGADGRAALLVSTQKAGDRVLLRIDRRVRRRA